MDQQRKEIATQVLAAMLVRDKKRPTDELCRQAVEIADQLIVALINTPPQRRLRPKK